MIRESMYAEFLEAMRTDDRLAMALCIHEGLDINHVEPVYNMSVMAEAIQMDCSIGVIEFLLDNGFNVNKTDSTSFGIFAEIFRKNRCDEIIKILTRLLKAGLNPNVAGKYGSTPLKYVIGSGASLGGCLGNSLPCLTAPPCGIKPRLSSIC